METGFPSPAQGYEAKALDLNALLVRSPTSTYLMEMSGHALESMGIYPKDLLIVDRAKKPKPESVVIAEYEGEYVCRVLHRTLDGSFKLVGRGVNPIPLGEDVRIVAAVLYSIRRLP